MLAFVTYRTGMASAKMGVGESLRLFTSGNSQVIAVACRALHACVRNSTSQIIAYVVIMPKLQTSLGAGVPILLRLGVA